MITDEHIAIITKRIIEAYNPKYIYLFGSYAWGIPEQARDVDLLVVVQESSEKPYRRSIKGYKALKGLEVGKDILVYTDKEFNEICEDPSSLCYKIKMQGKMIYEAA